MNWEISLKKIDKNIDSAIQKGQTNFNLENLISFITDKLNRHTSSEPIISQLEVILSKLLNNNFDTIVKVYCYCIISNFNHEFDKEFLESISKTLFNDAMCFDKFDECINALKNIMILNSKDIIDNLQTIEKSIKSPKYDINYIVNSFFYSNFPLNLLNMINKIKLEDIRQYKDFLTNFLLEFAKLLFFSKLQDGAFLNMLRILNKILNNFKCLEELNTRERIINSAIIPMSEYLTNNIDEIISLMQCFDIKLLVQTINFPIELYRIYNYYRDINNPNKKYENSFNNYMQFLFKNIRNIVDPDIFSEFTKTLNEFKIIENNINPDSYSTEVIECMSKFITFSEHLEKSSWFDNNIKILTHLINFIDYTEVMDLVLILLSETKNIKNIHDRILSLYNLFSSVVSLSLTFPIFFSREPLVLCLFKQDWFVLLVHKEPPEPRESRWRHEIFLALISAIFRTKRKILCEGNIEKIVELMGIGQDVIDVCFKILDWSDEGEAFKMYFLLLEEICLFFEDPFFYYIFNQYKDFPKMKARLDDILNEIAKRFLSKKWENLMFANEACKYRSLLILSKFLTPSSEHIPSILRVLFSHLNELDFTNFHEDEVEDSLKSALFFGVRTSENLRKLVIEGLMQFSEENKKKIKGEVNDMLITNIVNLSESLTNYLMEKGNDLGNIRMDNKTIDKFNNEFYLILPKDVYNEQKNTKNKNFTSPLFLMNICENSLDTLENLSNINTSTYLDTFKKYYYFPIIENNSLYCHFLIYNKYIYGDWKMISGICDPLRVWYRYTINIENKEIDLTIKITNCCKVILNNLSFSLLLSSNLIPNSHSLNHNSQSILPESQGIPEFSLEFLSPNASHETSTRFLAQKFAKSNIKFEYFYDLNDGQKTQGKFLLGPFYVPLTTFFMPDNFAIYEPKKFDIFYNTLEYAFTTKCFIFSTPENVVKNINKNISIIEFKFGKIYIENNINILDKIKETKYNEYFKREKEGNLENKDNPSKINSLPSNFKLKLATFSIYNFWVYILIIGEYNKTNNKCIFNIEVKGNDYNSICVLNEEKEIFLKEILSEKIKFY